LEINGSISGGRLRVTWSYSENLHHRATIEDWAQRFLAALRTLIRHCLSPEAGGYTPSDFPLAGLDQARLDALPAPSRQVEDLYPLAPLQHGLLFHTLYESGSGEYFEQMSCSMEGELDLATFRRVWQWAVDRHAILRTAFLWEGLDQPLQMVQRTATLPWAEQDWRALSPEELEQSLEALLRADRSRGFELSEAPLARVTLIRTGEEAYRFLFSFHHLLLDGWSVGRLLQEIFSCYGASCRGRAPELGSQRPYRDYIALLAQRDLAAAEVFWRRSLAGFTTPSVLSTEHRPQSVPGAPDYRAHGITMPATRSAALQSMAARHALTVNTLVQGAWALLVARYSAREDVVFGTTTSGRPADLPGVESMVGLFINTLPVRVRISPQEALPPWFERLQAQQAELRHYEYSPPDEVQRWSEVPADRVLFDHILVFENYPIDASLRQPVEGLKIRNVRTFERTNYALTVVVAPTPELRLSMLHDCRFLDPVTVLRMLGHFENLLRGVTVDPSAGSGPRRLGEVPMLSAGERQQLLFEWNDTGSDAGDARCIHELFAAQVERAPEAVAVVCARQRLSYRELDARANALALQLGEAGVGPEVLVALEMHSSAEMIVGLLGVLKAGGAYLPLDPAYPQERREFMVEDSGAAVVLTADGEKGVRLRSRRPRGVPAEVGPGNLAYAIYTSGSTGTPKGVAITHGTLMNLVSWHLQSYRVRPGDRATQVAGPAFDASVWEIWPYLAAGATPSIPAPETRSSPPDLVSWLVA
ncbi:MAG: AMP-binding protein, partial [bacterium]|nr:AMP-binding protein [bacterium]